MSHARRSNRPIVFAEGVVLLDGVVGVDDGVVGNPRRGGVGVDDPFGRGGGGGIEKFRRFDGRARLTLKLNFTSLHATPIPTTGIDSIRFE